MKLREPCPSHRLHLGLSCPSRHWTLLCPRGLEWGEGDREPGSDSHALAVTLELSGRCEGTLFQYSN